MSGANQNVDKTEAIISQDMDGQANAMALCDMDDGYLTHFDPRPFMRMGAGGWWVGGMVGWMVGGWAGGGAKT